MDTNARRRPLVKHEETPIHARCRQVAPVKLGVIGDDFTGSSDIALMLSGARGEGMRTVLYVGTPVEAAAPGVEAGVIALKSRSLPVAEAVAQSLHALEWLRAQGAERILFKICSTFDSTPEGNIGPVAEALMDALGGDAPVIVTPAFPATGRTVYRGHLFVGDALLSESGLERHPLTPMTDPNLVRWLGRQTRGAVGLVTLDTVAAGADAVRAVLMAQGRRLVICDAVRDEDLRVLGQAMVGGGMPLAVCGAGLAIGLPALLGAGGHASDWTPVTGPAVALSGSCSAATRAQIAAHEAEGHPLRRIDVDALIARDDASAVAAELADWACAQGGVPLLATSGDPSVVAAIQGRPGAAASAAAVEGLFAALATALADRGIVRIISAGGETSGAVVATLEARVLEIGPMIDPGVPAVAVLRHGKRLGLALKSGNFGAPDFFAKAARIIGGDA